MLSKKFWSYFLICLGSLSVTLLFAIQVPTSAQTGSSPIITTTPRLTFADRLDCQNRLDQFYWEATLWPETNPQPKPAWQEVMTPAASEARLEDRLAQAAALVDLWQLPVTGEMLQAEMERMAAHSQSPQRLRAIFAALDHDPAKIAECLARPLLVERLLRQKVSYDPDIHAATRAQATAALATIQSGQQLADLPQAQTITWATDELANHSPTGELVLLDDARFNGRLADLRRAFNLPADAPLPLNQPTALQEDASRFYALAVLAQDEGQISVVYAGWPKQSFADWWAANRQRFDGRSAPQPDYPYRLPTLVDRGETFNPTGDSWRYLPALPWHTGDSRSVWTGSVMLVWGGAYTTNGYRYDPALDDWRPITTLNAPLARSEFTAVWTGSEMIVFGGCSGHTQFCSLGSGGRYEPLTDSWSAITPGSVRKQHTAVWSGSEMLVWGGCREDANGHRNCNILVEQGARYNPATNSWSNMTLDSAPAGARRPRSVWAGDQMVIWNGSGGVNGRYFPDSNTWQTINLTNAPEPGSPSLIWTGTEVIAWGGCTGTPLCSTSHNSGGRYDPAADSWTPTSLDNAPSPRQNHTAVWDGGEMLVWGGLNNNTYLGNGGRYDPVTDSWTPIGSSNAPSARGSHHAHWTGQVMLVWGGYGNGDERSGGRYNPATDSWTPTSTNDPYRVAAYHATVWSGTQMITWGGEGEQFINPFYQRARLYDPATDIWSMSSVNSDLTPYSSPTAVWTGEEMIVWGGQSGANIFDEGGRYNPLSDSWTPTSLVNAPEGRGNHSAIWTGTEMIVWGGSTWEDPYEQTGGRYNPTTDSWQGTTLTNAPEGRNLHQAVWSGSEMIVWGGRIATGFANNGGRYDPVTNSWQAVSLTNAPGPRALFAAVWTEDEMIVWGGLNGFFSYAEDGGRYNPLSNSWTTTSQSNAPDGRARFDAVWTGQEMIVWGGCHESNCLTSVHTGGRYAPAEDSWTATSVEQVIEAREFHTMVWTGQEMLAWGGQTAQNGYTHTGGGYALTAPENSPPQANDDEYSLTANSVLTVTAPGVLANDFDPDGDPLTATLVIYPTQGSLLLNADGGFVYTPDADFVGLDTFYYRASDGQAESNLAQVSLQVLAEPNQPPVAGDDWYSSPADELLTVSAPGVLLNDSDPDDDPLQAVLVAAPAEGQLNLAINGGFTYLPPVGFTGVITFTYQAYDGQAYSNTAVVTITIEADDTAPMHRLFLPLALRP
jgi:N-acetylneuraminic acid mutarotase